VSVKEIIEEMTMMPEGDDYCNAMQYYEENEVEI